MRTIICIYSMILNGYRPPEVWLYGEHQWTPEARRSFAEWLPFARVAPTNRYSYPVFDGMPGGIVGYDYAGNPSGLVSVHFGGLFEKPSDTTTILLAADILGRQTATSGR